MDQAGQKIQISQLTTNRFCADLHLLKRDGQKINLVQQTTIKNLHKLFFMSTRALTKPSSVPSLFDDFFRPWNEWFDDRNLFNRVATIPSVNITENHNHYNVALAAPGLKKEDFKIDVEGNMLTISSEKEEKKEEKEDRYTRKEYSYSSFSRSFTLPDDVKEEAIEASYENGVLNLKLPRKENSKKTSASKRIAVK